MKMHLFFLVPLLLTTQIALGETSSSNAAADPTASAIANSLGADVGGVSQNQENNPTIDSASPWTPQEEEAARQWREMTPSQRQEYRNKIKEALEKLTPEQRAQMNSMIRKHLEQMTPQQKENLVNNLNDYWSRLSPQEKEELFGNSEPSGAAKSP